jgi:ribonuclease P protein component
VAGATSYPKVARLRRRPEFLRLQRGGQRQHTRSFVVIRSPSPGPLSRLGVTVSTRVGNAVTRNRIKRIVREIFRQRRANLPPATDMVVIAKPGAHTLTYAQAAAELARALESTPAG